MTRYGKLLLLVVLGFLSQPGKTAATSDIVDGFSEFLIERANANLVSVFERRLKEDEKFRYYFPNTHKKIKTIKLENLFSSRNYWETSLDQDLEELINRSISLEVQKSLSSLVSKLNYDRILFAASKFVYVYEGETYPINQIGLDWPEPLRNQVNGFYDGLLEIGQGLETRLVQANLYEEYLTNPEQLEKDLEYYLSASNTLEDWLVHVVEYGKNLGLTSKDRLSLYCEPQEIDAASCENLKLDSITLISIILDVDAESVEEAIKIASRITEAREAIKALNAMSKQELDAISEVDLTLPLLQSAKLPLEKVGELQKTLRMLGELPVEARKKQLVQVLKEIKLAGPDPNRELSFEDADFVRITGLLRSLINLDKSYTDRALIALEYIQKSELLEISGYERLNRGVMFFVSIADADNKDAVKNLLKVYTLPEVSYTEKRKLGEGFFISSYLGFSYVDSDVQDSEEDTSENGLFIPVGIEMNYGFGDGDSLSVMFSPIDMAYPVNLKLSGIEDDVEFDEIVAPSITLAYGFRNYPLNVGLGYQRGRRLDDIDESEERILLFVTFDMPLFRLY